MLSEGTASWLEVGRGVAVFGYVLLFFVFRMGEWMSFNYWQLLSFVLLFCVVVSFVQLPMLLLGWTKKTWTPSFLAERRWLTALVHT